MFEHLTNLTEQTLPGFQPVEDVAHDDLLAAQLRTADWLDELGVPDDADIDAAVQRSAARRAFGAIAADPETTDEAKKQALIEIRTPEAVRHLVGMLSAYDWEFVEQARQLRGFVVAKILEEVSHPDARVRLKALQMLGSVTEVASFTERVEVRKVDMNEAELNERLQEKLRSLMAATVVADVSPALPVGDVQ